MYKNKKIIVVSPVGRKQSLKCLFKEILKNKHVIDEHHLWMNTNIKDDLDFIHEYAENNKSFVKLKYGCTDLDPSQMTKADNVKHFYNYCIEPNTFYFKLDDDIIYIENCMFEKMAQYKIDNPNTFLIYPTILNNCWCTYFLVKNKAIDAELCTICDIDWYRELKNNRELIKNSTKIMSDNLDEPKAKDFLPEYVYLSPLYWKNPYFAETLLNLSYNLIKNNKLDSLNIKNILLDYEPISINCIMWAGENFAKFDGNVKCYGDEPWLAVFYPLQHNEQNVMLGNTRCVHYAFWPQKAHLDTTDILEKFYEI